MSEKKIIFLNLNPSRNDDTSKRNRIIFPLFKPMPFRMKPEGRKDEIIVRNEKNDY